MIADTCEPAGSTSRALQFHSIGGSAGWPGVHHGDREVEVLQAMLEILVEDGPTVLHQDLQHRLEHFHLPVTVVNPRPPG